MKAADSEYIQGLYDNKLAAERTTHRNKNDAEDENDGQHTGVEVSAALARRFQNRVLDLEIFNNYCKSIITAAKSKDLKLLESTNMSYSTHYLHVSKLKAIHKEQEFFRISVGEKRRKIVDSIKRSETAKVTRDNTLLLRINSSHFEQLVLPMIQDKLDIKLFCLQRLRFLKVVISINPGIQCRRSPAYRVPSSVEDLQPRRLSGDARSAPRDDGVDQRRGVRCRLGQRDEI